ncbi:MAG: branched-chain amino acid ABC transporter substrate-binding protein [Micromonosporaceae bacterium]|nr:branched-chain amino acid ABC transporter substrate-binding protein [Micromonosporaceae bacterium]
MVACTRVLGWARAALGVLGCLGAVGCAGVAAQTPAQTIEACHAKVAFFGPLTGRSEDLGMYIRNGAQLAVEGYNQQHRGCPVELLYFDTQGDPKQAPAMAQQIVADGQIIGVVGPAFSGEAETADPLLDQAGVATITASATETALSTRDWRTFHRIIGNDSVQGPAAGRYIAKVLRAKKVFVVDDSEAYGQGLANEVIRVLDTDVVQSGTVLVGQLDFTDLVKQIRAAAPDAIFFGGYYQQAGALLTQVRRAGVRATFVSGDAVKDEGFLHQAGRYAENAVITCPCQPPERSGDDFAGRYRTRFGTVPGTYSAEAYDAANVFLQGLQAGRLSRPAMTNFVSDYSGTGVTGTIRFTPAGERVASSVTVWAYRVRNGGIVADQPIPSS